MGQPRILRRPGEPDVYVYDVDYVNGDIMLDDGTRLNADGSGPESYGTFLGGTPSTPSYGVARKSLGVGSGFIALEALGLFAQSNLVKMIDPAFAQNASILMDYVNDTIIYGGGSIAAYLVPIAISKGISRGISKFKNTHNKLSNEQNRINEQQNQKTIIKPKEDTNQRKLPINEQNLVNGQNQKRTIKAKEDTNQRRLPVTDQKNKAVKGLNLSFEK